VHTLLLFFKGCIIGLGKIIPGVSGSLLAISLGIYEEALQKINSLWKTKKESCKFLLPLGIGIALAVLLGSKVMLYFLNTYYVYTMMVFIGLIVGTVPNIIKKESFSNKDYLFITSIVLGVFYLNSHLKFPEFIPHDSLFSFLFILFLGFVDAFTMILPGISGTATYMMIGSYNFVLELFASPFNNLFYCILFGIGLIIGVFIMIKVVNYCFRNHRHTTWMCIIGFLISSILSLAIKVIDFINSVNLFPLILLFIIGYSVINFFGES